MRIESAPLTPPKYRPDIDGLRAVAVLSVIGFHAFPAAVPGGYTGVDVFFVISGFLISTIIFENLERGTFSLAEFYARRIHRIFPALLAVMAACVVAGWFVLLADEYRQVGKHVAAGAGFVSNFVLWGESGYFDNAAETKPLLHLWSLGIEEQFYLTWPVLLWAAWNRKFNLPALTVPVLAASFALNVHDVPLDAVATFYSPQTRFWELLSGSLLALLVLRNKDALGKLAHKAGNALAASGGVLLGLGAFLISRQSAFPGWWALLPVLAAVLVILAGPQAWVNRVVLSSRVMVWFGLISFPLYLWHWPLLSFARIYEGRVPGAGIRVAAVAASVLAAWLTYRLIERPIRFGPRRPAKTLGLVLALVVVGCMGYYTYAENGLPFKKPLIGEAAKISNYSYFDGKSEAEYWADGCFNLTEGVRLFKSNHCEDMPYPGRPKVFLVGDSHSAYLSQYLRGYLDKRKLNFFQFSVNCTLLSVHDTLDRCRYLNSYILKRIAEEKPEVMVLFAYHFSPEYRDYYREAVPYEQFISGKIAEFSQLGIKKIILIGQIPTWEDTLPHILLKRFARKGEQIPERTYDGVVPLSLEWDDRLGKQSYPEGVTYLSLRNLLCNAEGCLTRVGPDLGTDLIVFDYGHLTKAGARFITERLLSEHLR